MSAYKVGDMVWYNASRDRERMGTIIKIVTDLTLNTTTYIVHIENSEDKVYCVKEDLRPAFVSIVKSDISNDTATKHDSGKNRLELIPTSGVEAAGRAFTFGATKYSAHNWANGFDWSRLIGAALRHITSFNNGEDKDPESGLSHVDHALACLMMLAAHETEKLGNDDRRKVCKK